MERPRAASPLHSDAVVVEPGVSADLIGQRLLARASAGVEDSFATLDVTGLGLRELLIATWLAREPDPAPPRTPPGCSPAPASPCWPAGPTGGSSPGPSPASAPGWSRSPTPTPPPAPSSTGRSSSTPSARFPGRRLVGFEHGEALDAARAAGFTTTGALRVWVR